MNDDDIGCEICGGDCRDWFEGEWNLDDNEDIEVPA